MLDFFAGQRTSSTLNRRRPMQNADDLDVLPEQVAPRRLKRAVDFFVALILVCLISPLFLVVAFLVWYHDRGPVLYRQERVGWRGRPFAILKFRSMYVNNDDSALREAVERALKGEDGLTVDGSFKLAADPRVTPVGRVIRALSIDELPQLLNVIRGDMSLVGPRPALAWEMDLFPPEFRRRTDAVPGITGLWQVSGRSRVSTMEMLRYDLSYVDNQSLWLDTKILLRTIPTLVRRDGAR